MYSMYLCFLLDVRNPNTSINTMNAENNTPDAAGSERIENFLIRPCWYSSSSLFSSASIQLASQPKNPIHCCLHAYSAKNVMSTTQNFKKKRMRSLEFSRQYVIK